VIGSKTRAEAVRMRNMGIPERSLQGCDTKRRREVTLSRLCQQG
jgi:hypothetical protein